MKISSINNSQLNFSNPVFQKNGMQKSNMQAGNRFLERSADILFCSGIILTLAGGGSIVQKIKDSSAITKIGIGALIASGILVLSNIIYKIINNNK